MDMNEYTHWQAYCLLEPFGGDVDFLRTGILTATIANTNRRKEARPFTATDFVPDFKKPYRPTIKQTFQSIKATMMNLVKTTKGRGKKK